MKAPRLWRFVTRTFKIEDRLARAWWDALTASTWSEPSSFRQMIWWAETHGSPQAFLETTWRINLLISVLEELKKEGRLPRATATAIEETLLNMTMADGHWRMQRGKAPGETPEMSRGESHECTAGIR